MRGRDIVLIGIGEPGGVLARDFPRPGRCALVQARRPGIELPLLHELQADTATEPS